MEIYDKLIRDRIPEIIEASGKQCEVEVVSNDATLEYLYKKLNEEVCELLYDRILDEVIDVMEVLFAIGVKYGYSEQYVLDKRNERKAIRVGFENNLILKKTY